MPYKSMVEGKKHARMHTKKANTAKKQRQWVHVEESMRKRGKSPGAAVRAANAVVGRGPHPNSISESG